MSKFSRLARIAAAAIFATGIFAGSVAPASAAHGSGQSTHYSPTDTGWD